METISYTVVSKEMATLNKKYYPFILLAIALLVRSIYFYQFQSNPYFAHVPKLWDQAIYHKAAQAFANGDILAVAPGIINYFAPLYQYFLGIIYWAFGVNLTAAWIAQLLLGAVSTLLVYFIGLRYFEPGVSFLASLLFTFYGVNWLYETTLFRASFITFLELMSCIYLIRFAERPGFLRMVLSSLFLALLTQSRTNYLLIVPFALFYLWKKVFLLKPAGKKMLAGYLFIFVLASAPSLAWVHAVHGSWGLYDRTGPENLLLANMVDHDPRIYGHGEGYNEIARTLPLETVPVLRYLLKTGWEHPLEFLKIYLRKIYYYFNNYEVPNAYNFYLSQDFSSLLKWVSIPFVFLSSLGGIGFVLLRKEKRSWTLLHAYFIANVLMYLPALILSRYRISIIPFLALFSAYCLWVAYPAMRQKRFFFLAMLFSCFLLLNFIAKTNPHLEGKIRQMDYINMGSTIFNNDIPEDNHKGYEYLKKASDLSRTLKPELRATSLLREVFSQYYARESIKFREQGSLQKELIALKKSLVYDYAQPVSHYQYGILSLNVEKNTRKALLESLQAIVLDPNIQEMHELSALIYKDLMNKPLWALYHLEKALNLTEGEDKGTLPKEIKSFRATLEDQQVLPGNLQEIESVLRNQMQPLLNFPFKIGLPYTIYAWTPKQTEEYLVALYQHLILLPETNVPMLYYQLGMIYLEKIHNAHTAFHYLREAWDSGVQFADLETVLNRMDKKRQSQLID